MDEKIRLIKDKLTNVVFSSLLIVQPALIVPHLVLGTKLLTIDGY